MSTRRARIKAVTSLPPRRKNADNVDNKAVQPKDSQKSIKSPLTPKSIAKSNEDSENATKSPPALLPITTSALSKINSPLAKTSLETPRSVIKTPKLAEKVSVITSASSTKSVFASPQPRIDSPLRNTASPLAALLRSTPKSNHLDPFKSVTPQRSQIKTKESLEQNQVIKPERTVIEKPNSVVSDSKSDAPEDYNVPSIPESLTESVSEDAVMDGIIPLQPTRSVPKPIDLLKNEIISEHAEVLFDPIVPLPSPSKVRPKLRPVPRLAPLRRNSIQGSASESEDESRRALLGGTTTPAPPRQRHDSHTSHSTLQLLYNRDMNRIRSDSVSSSVSQAAAHPPPATSPTKEKQYNKTRRQEITRRMAAMRRRRETVKREALTMYDLIFYNPTTNPIVPDQDEIKAKEANKQDELERQTEQADDPDDPPPAADAPVPQIKLGPNGEIILDETSLVIKQTDSKRKVSSVVREGAWGGGGGKYSRSSRTADWSSEETVRFYRALAAVGTDFTLMAPLFPDRTRRDLKLKFKKEEKINGAQVDKALCSSTAWDPVGLQEEFEQERAAAAEKKIKEKERLRKQREEEVQRLSQVKPYVRRSRASKAVETTILPEVPTKKHGEAPMTANEIVQRALAEKMAKSRKRREDAEKRKRTATPLATSISHSGPLSTTNLSSKEMATITRIEKSPSLKTPSPAPNSNPSIPPNIESGSLVVLTVNDPNSPSKKMLQTYIAHGAGKLTPVALPPNFLSTVVGYMKKGTPKSNSTGSPQFISPAGSSNSQDRTTPNLIQMNASPAKRQRHSSYTMTQL